MKRKRTTIPKLFAWTALCGYAALFSADPAMAIGKPVIKIHSGNEKPKEDPAKKAKARMYSSRNNSSVKIYPDVIKREMHVVAKENDGRAIEFFVFDLEGTLIQNYKMKAKDHIRLNGLKRGKYQYSVFCGDIETAAGNFEIR